MTQQQLRRGTGARWAGLVVLVVMATSVSITAGAGVARAAVTLPPPVITSLTSNSTYPFNTVTLEWQSGSPGSNTEIQRFRLRSGEWIYEYTFGPYPPTQTLFLDGSTTTPALYAYLVRHVNAAGTDTSEWVTATVNVPSGQTAPGPVQNLFVDPGNEPTVGWSVQTDIIYGVEVLRARNDVGVWDFWSTSVVSEGYHFDDAPIDGFYAYLARSYNAAGYGPWTFAGTNVVNHSTAAPATPNFSLTSSSSTVTASWANVAEETRYTLQRARYLVESQTWGEWTFTLHGRDTTSATLSNVPDGIYAYVLTADNAVGSSIASIQQVSVSRATLSPDAPTNLNAVASGGDVNVTWVDNSFGADGELYFDVQRAQLVNNVWTNWTSWAVDKNATTFTDHGVAPGSYTYLVRAHNLLGDSAWASFTIVVMV